MAIVKTEDLLGWQMKSGELVCLDCEPDPDDALPLDEHQLKNDDIVVCDRCFKRIH